MAKNRTKRPRDLNQLAASIVEATTQEQAEPEEEPQPEPETEESTSELNEEGKNPHAVALGRLGGKKGGPARMRKLTAEQRSELARKAAQARWSHKTT